MSVWPEPFLSHEPFLSGSEGELVSASISVEPQFLEQLLDALAQAPFPVNPQIYHNAEVRCVYATGAQITEPATLVEFPAYHSRLEEVRELLRRGGFLPQTLWVKNLLDDIHSDEFAAPAPPGSPFVKVVRRKRAARAI